MAELFESSFQRALSAHLLSVRAVLICPQSNCKFSTIIQLDSLLFSPGCHIFAIQVTDSNCHWESIRRKHHALVQFKKVDKSTAAAETRTPAEVLIISVLVSDEEEDTKHDNSFHLALALDISLRTLLYYYAQQQPTKMSFIDL